MSISTLTLITRFKEARVFVSNLFDNENNCIAFVLQSALDISLRWDNNVTFWYNLCTDNLSTVYKIEDVFEFNGVFMFSAWLVHETCGRNLKIWPWKQNDDSIDFHDEQKGKNACGKTKGGATSLAASSWSCQLFTNTVNLCQIEHKYIFDKFINESVEWRRNDNFNSQH